ncbi:MAG: DUF1848 domain-containing protein [Acetivibrio ethanolgignens]
MIINISTRTDIPAYYSQWFYNRIREGYVLVRNPYCPEQVLKYQLSPDVVDIFCFCTKNPEPMLDRLDEIKDFSQFWSVTITPYGKEIEPNVPDKEEVMESFRRLSKKAGIPAISWRYDPIFITATYSLDFHINTFSHMAKTLSGCTDQCVISFIDLYAKTKRNFPNVREVTGPEQEKLVQEFVGIGRQYGITIRTCCENTSLERFGADVSGCMTKPVLERAIGCSLSIPKSQKPARAQCSCLLGNDIGAYNTCPHGCLYCYANYDRKTVLDNLKLHDVNSPFLIGSVRENDIIKEARQVSYRDGQISLFPFLF